MSIEIKRKTEMNWTDTCVKLRRMPYPYKSMFAICSDLDGTPGKQAYLEIMRFLNTTDMTAMGPGVGLEVGNSIHFHAKPQRFSYWSTNDAGREMVRALIHSGHIDCLHSFGERVFVRAEVKKALDDLQKHNCRLKVWVDHGGAVTNFGSDIMQGRGDEVGHSAYHADLTIEYGVQFVWRGRITSVIGQDVPARLAGMLNWHHPILSSRTLLKEMAKRAHARCGDMVYAMHGSNAILRPVNLRDGRPVYEFMRCNPHYGGVSSCAQGTDIGEVLTQDMLNCLVDRQGTCILYTHLGKNIADVKIPLNKDAVEGLHRLAEAHRNKRILVTTTRRLLEYCLAAKEISYSTSKHNNRLYINLDTHSPNRAIGDVPLDDLSGLTFYVPKPEVTCFTVDGTEVDNLVHNPPDCTGHPSVSFPWPRLALPQMPF